jgi:hypothetical protein
MNPSAILGQLVAGAYGAQAETAPSAPAPQAAPKRRRKLWELEDKHHCPVIGTCVPMAELQRLARRFRFESGPKDEFALHVEAVQHSMSRGEVAEALQRSLERRHAASIRRFDAARSDGQLRALWQERLAQGEVAGPLWAALTHPAASAETRQLVYADIHMLSHQVGAGQAADARRLAHLEQESQHLRAALEQERRERIIAETVFREHIRRLETELAHSAAEAAQVPRLRDRLAAMESGSVHAALEQRLANLELANRGMRSAAARCGELEAENRTLRSDAAALARERDVLAGERDALERLLLAPQESSEACPGPCPAGDARAGGGRCVLCVGGRTSLLAHYRALAGRLGIRLMHHDGGQEEALSRLPDMIDGADAVICPTDCVSHAAYYRLKRQCKLSGKPCLLFKGAGISSFAVALTRFSGTTPAAGTAIAAAAD